jgi:hypothetical protein
MKMKKMKPATKVHAFYEIEDGDRSGQYWGSNTFLAALKQAKTPAEAERVIRAFYEDRQSKKVA